MTLFIPIFLFATVAFLGFAFAFSGDTGEVSSDRVNRLLNEDLDHPADLVYLERKNNLSHLPFFDRLLKNFGFSRGLLTWIRQSGISISPGAFLLLSSLLGTSAFLFGHMIHFGTGLSLLMAPSAMLIPFGYLSVKRSARMKQFSTAFPSAVGRMATSLQAGYSLQMALEAVVEDSDMIVGEEFRKVLAEMEVGQSFESALKKILERMDTPDLRLFIASVIIQRESGGNLAELLNNLEATIQDRFSLARELNAATAQAKLSGLVLSFLPVFVGVCVYVIHPQYILFLFEDPAGRMMLWISVIGQILGILTIKKIVSIQI